MTTSHGGAKRIVLYLDEINDGLNMIGCRLSVDFALQEEEDRLINSLCAKRSEVQFCHSHWLFMSYLSGATKLLCRRSMDAGTLMYFQCKLL